MRASAAFVIGLGLGGAAVYVVIKKNQEGNPTGVQEKQIHLTKLSEMTAQIQALQTEQKKLQTEKDDLSGGNAILGDQMEALKAHHGEFRQAEVEAIERDYFAVIDRKLMLPDEKINRLKTLLIRSNSENKDVFANCQNLQDILEQIQAVHRINARRYRHITANLTEAGVDDTLITWQINQLSQAIKDVEKGDKPKGFKADPFKYDAIIIHCDENRDEVKDFIDNARVNLGVQDLSLESLENFNISQPNLQSIENVFCCARYVYVFVTSELTQDRFNRFMAGVALIDSLKDDEKKWRIIPIWTTRSRVCILEFEGFPGLKYWKYFDKSSRRAFLKLFENHILDGRKTILQT